MENRLEQLRALDNSIKINVALAKSSPIGVDTEEEVVVRVQLVAQHRRQFVESDELVDLRAGVSSGCAGF